MYTDRFGHVNVGDEFYFPSMGKHGNRIIKITAINEIQKTVAYLMSDGARCDQSPINHWVSEITPMKETKVAKILKMHE